MSAAGGQGGNAGVASLRWWLPEFAGERKRAEACFRWADHVMRRQDLRARMHLFNAQMYEDLPTLGLGPYQYTVFDMGGERLRMNLVKAVTDTYTAQICRSKPKPQALTSGGDWGLKKKAKGLTRWWEGKADEIELYDEVSDPCCLHSAVFGLGVAQVYRENPHDKRIYDVGVEMAFAHEMIADDAEWQTRRRARTLARRKVLDRLVVAEMFPDKADFIRNHAPRAGVNSSTVYEPSPIGTSMASDLIPVTEFWRLPTFTGAKDGLHVIAVEGMVLYEGPWERDRFPFAFLYRDRPTMGLFGTSIPHQLRGRQMHINTTLADIEECLRLYGKPKLMAPAGSIETDALDDDVDSIILYAGQVPPQVYSPRVMPQEVYDFLWAQWRSGFEEIGTSSNAGAGKVDEGISGSGASIRASNDVQDGRLYKPSQNFETFHMQLADLMIDEARDIAKERPDYASTYRGKKYVQIVKFRDVDPGKDRYFLRVYPVSRLSKNPAQRLAQLQELFNAKVIDGEAFRQLLDFPDLESEDDLMNAPRNLADKLIDQFLEADDPTDPDVFMYPEPEWPLQAMKARMQFAEVLARLDGAPEGNCKLLRDFIRLCDVEMAKAAQAMAPGAPAGPPGLPPGPPPPNAAQFPPGTLSPVAGPQQPKLAA